MLHMIMCVLLCYPVSIHMSQLLSTGRLISSSKFIFGSIFSRLLSFKMSTHQTNKDKLRSNKCRHFCLPFDVHNYCPTCRESGKGDDPGVTFENPCRICASFTEEQMLKISQRKRYIKKQKGNTVSFKNDELDLLGDDVDSFTGSNADLESAADNLFTSPPRPQPLPFSSLSIKTPAKAVPPTPGTALQQIIESNLEKSLGNILNNHLQQQMGSFQASMLEAFQSLRDKLTTKKQAEVVQTSAAASKPGTSSSAVNLDLPPPRPFTNPQTEDMDVDYGPALPPHLGSDHQNVSDQNSNASEEPSKKVSDRSKKHSQRKHDVDPRSASDQFSDESDQHRMSSTKPKKHADKSKYKSCPDMCHLPQRKISPLWLSTGLQSPLGLSPLWLSLTKTNLNMIQTLLIIGK